MCLKRFCQLGFAPIPVLCAITATAQDATLIIDPNTLLEQKAGPHSVADVDRERYFRTYHIPGMFNEELADELKALNVSPGRGTGPYLKGPGGDTNRAGYSPRLERQSERFAEIYNQARSRYGDIVHAIAGGNYPEASPDVSNNGTIQVDDTMLTKHRKGVQPADFDEAVGLIKQWLGGIRDNDANLPTYFSALNEPDATWDNTPEPVNDFLDFSRLMAIKLKEDFPEVLVAGPCTAWGHPLGSWRRWSGDGSGWEKKYIERVGDVSDAYDFHLYTKEYWAHGSTEPDAKRPANKQDYPNMHDQFNNGNIYVWDFGKAEAFLDLVYAHHQATWGEPSLPVIITEFGRQGITPQLGPWNSEYLYHLYGATVIRLWMSFMDRPEVDLTVPFILPESDRGYGAQRGQALYTRPDAPEDLTVAPTRFLDYFRFLQDLRGDRVVSRWSGMSPGQAVGLFNIAARDGDHLWVLVHNAPTEGTTIKLDLGETEIIGEPRIARMRWEGDEPEHFSLGSEGTWRIDHELRDTIDIDSVRLTASETAIISIRLTTDQADEYQVVDRFFAASTLLPLGGQDVDAARFTLELPEAAANRPARLIASVSSPAGFKPGTQLDAWMNGHKVTLPLDFAEGTRDLLAPVRFILPEGILRQGQNIVQFQVAGEEIPHGARIVTARVDVDHPIQMSVPR